MRSVVIEKEFSKGETPSKIKLIALLAVAVTAVSLAAILAVLASAPGTVTAFWRLLFSLSFIFVLKPDLKLPERKSIFFPAVAGLALGIHFASWIESLFYASVAVSTTIVCTHALFSGFFSSIFGERPRKSQVAGTVIALTGVYFLSGADPSSSPYGVSLALIGAVAGGVYFTAGRFVGERMQFNTYIFLTYSFATITALFIALIKGYDLFNYPAETWVYFLLLALIPMSVGHTLLNYILRYMRALSVTTGVLGEAVGASILAYLILGQLLPGEVYIYMLVVLFGIGIVLRE
jgi:drug/metabolite transporter (DMT)-like permease